MPDTWVTGKPLWHSSFFTSAKEALIPRSRRLMSLREDFSSCSNKDASTGYLCQWLGFSRRTKLQEDGTVKRCVAGGLCRPIPAAVRGALLAGRRAHPCWDARNLRKRLVTRMLTSLAACLMCTIIMDISRKFGNDSPRSQRYNCKGGTLPRFGGM